MHQAHKLVASSVLMQASGSKRLGNRFYLRGDRTRCYYFQVGQAGAPLIFPCPLHHALPCVEMADYNY